MLPTIWFKNTWSWGRTGESYWSKPRIELKKDGELLLSQETLGKFHLAVEPFLGSEPPKFLFTDDPHWRDLILYHEYFCGDSGHGLGANHQTGWTALIARLLDDVGSKR